MRSISLIAASLLACAGMPAQAQTFGPPIQGLCLLSRAGAIAASRAGQSMQAQLKQMQGSLNGDLAQRRAALDQQRRQLEARQSAIAPIEYQRQLTALNQQAQTLEQQQNARFIAVQQRGQQQIDGALGQALSRVVTRTACSVVMERDHAYGWNNAMDVTGAVTKEMDAILPAIALQ
ncbi:OmpH family outer membrane protein [Sphingomonas cannabina]|uniref:OmpH family outer membrane protein n=1 Tax=Sphingomonas cannabina TaxID=2899123 RepID=UPI001F2136D1|nr:OmpH family outer membrane protein [Sphingomonas cannabina]UIJ45516.1 OmpH family outer membrane protein [Sphingomonas cannabina]